MDVLDFILDGLEAALELERELGVRAVECDRGLLGGEKITAPRLTSQVLSPSGVTGGLETKDLRRETGAGLETRDAGPAAVNRTIDTSKPQTPKTSNTQNLDLCFLHDRPLSPGGVEMMAKIIVAMHRTAENTPIVVEPPMPRAKVLVVLGVRALKKYFPGQKSEPGQWFRTPGGRDVLVTYSPEYILRFGTVTPAVQKMKKDMWTSLKAVVQRCNQ